MWLREPYSYLTCTALVQAVSDRMVRLEHRRRGAHGCGISYKRKNIANLHNERSSLSHSRV